MNGNVSRRNFIKSSVIMGGAAALALNSAAGIFGQSVVMAQTDDLSIITFEYTLESVAIDVYSAAASLNLLPKAALDVAVKFQSQHKEHQAAFAAVIQQMSGKAPTPPKGPYSLPELKTAEDILKFAKTLEEVAVGSYYSAVGKLKDPQLAATSASIFGVEAQHVAVFAAALKQDPIPSAFVTGASEDVVTKTATAILTPPAQGGAAMPTGVPSTGAGGAKPGDDYTGAVLGVIGAASAAAAVVLATRKAHTDDSNSEN
jgi:hypothetical protein